MIGGYDIDNLDEDYWKLLGVIIKKQFIINLLLSIILFIFVYNINNYDINKSKKVIIR